nr:migration and invasion-inhibitory protein isoform X3 [Oryctolagus cuniculus]
MEREGGEWAAGRGPRGMAPTSWEASPRPRSRLRLCGGTCSLGRYGDVPWPCWPWWIQCQPGARHGAEGPSLVRQEEELGPGSGAEDVLWPPEQPRWLWAPEPGMVETEELARLRRLSLQLLRQLWAGRDAVRHLVAQAASESSLDPSSSYNSKVSLSPETSSSSSRACSPPDAQQADPSDVASLGRVSSRVTSLPPARRQHQASLGQPRARSAPLLPITDSRDPEPSAGQGDLGSQEAQAPRSVLAQPSKSTVTCEDLEVPESSWRLRPYLGYDWIAGFQNSTAALHWNACRCLPAAACYMAQEAGAVAQRVKAPTCSAHVPCGCRFESRLLHFQSSSLLVYLGGQRRMAQVFEPPHPSGRPGRSSWLLAFTAIWRVNQQTDDLSVCLLLCLCNSAFQINNS